MVVRRCCDDPHGQGSTVSPAGKPAQPAGAEVSVSGVNPGRIEGQDGNVSRPSGPGASERQAVAIFRRGTSSGSTAMTPDPQPAAPELRDPSGRKSGPTPSRKEAEAARRQRVTKTYTKREARALASRSSRADRMKALAARDNTPEKALMRDYVDARFSIGEILLPALVLILATSFLNTVFTRAAVIGTVVMYVYVLAVLVDLYLMWRGFKKVLAKRLPGTSTKGLLFYGANRAIQIRRFRIPSPRIKRGEKY